MILLVNRVVSQHRRDLPLHHVPRAGRRRVHLRRRKRPRPTRASITFHPATLSRIGTLQKNPSCSLVAFLTRTHWASRSMTGLYTITVPDMAGELWLLLIQLAGKVKRAEECMPRIRSESNREMVGDLIESGDLLMDKLTQVV